MSDYLNGTGTCFHGREEDLYFISEGATGGQFFRGECKNFAWAHKLGDLTILRAGDVHDPTFECETVERLTLNYEQFRVIMASTVIAREVGRPSQLK
jgi:hypothetical protein